MSGEIQNARQRIQEEVVPKAEKLLDTEHHMVGLSRTTANHLLSAKKGILDHVVPHLQQALATKADLYRTGVEIVTQAEDVRADAHAVLGDTALYTETIGPVMAKTQKDTHRAALAQDASFTIAGHVLEALEVLEQSIGEVSDAAFKRADDITNNDIHSTHAIITALEEFDL